MKDFISIPPCKNAIVSSSFTISAKMLYSIFLGSGLNLCDIRAKSCTNTSWRKKKKFHCIMNHRVKTIHTWAKSCRSSCENLQVINSQETSNERKILYDLLVLNKNCLSQSVVHVPALILNTADIMFHSDIWTAWHQNTVACKLQQSARPHLQVSEGDEKWSNSPVPAALILETWRYLKHRWSP